MENKTKQVEKLNVEKCLVYAKYSTNVKFKWPEQVLGTYTITTA